MSSTPSASYSRSSSTRSSARSSRSVSPKPSSASGFLNNLYQQKTFNLLFGVSILFFIVILSFTCFEVKETIISEKCQCEENQFYNGAGCAPIPTLDDDFKDIKSQIGYSLKENMTIGQLKAIDEMITKLDDQIIYTAIYQLGNYVDENETIHSCKEEKSYYGYEITVIILFIICCALAIISFLGRNSYI